VISFALLSSLVVALMLIPMLASRLMVKPVVGSKERPLPGKTMIIHRISTSFFSSLENGYTSLLILCLKHRKITVMSVIVILLLSMGLIPFIGVEYMPSADESEVRVYATMDVGTHLDVLSERFKSIENIVRESVPEAKNMITRLGSSHWRGGGSHSGRMQISLKPVAERNRSSDEVANDLRRKLANIPGVLIRTRSGQGLFIFRLAFSSDDDKIQIDIRGYDIKTAERLSMRVKEMVEKVPGVTDVRLSLEAGRPEENIIVDRDRAAAMRLTVSDIASTLQTILSGTSSGQYREGGKEVDIMVKVKNADSLDIKDLLELTVVNAIGEPIVLKNVVTVQQRRAPVQIQRKDQERVVTLSINTTGRDMGSVLSDIQESLSRLVLPRDFSIVYTGDYEAQQEAFQELLVSMLLAILLVYMVLASLYESVRDPLVVLFSVPLAIVGVTLMLFLTETTFNVQSYIGCIMLAGIVVNNAILLVDQINLIRSRANVSVNKAIVMAGRRRLRPILMTACTTILGMLPMSLGLFEGGETQAALARAVIGGLTSSTLITLIFVPVLYSLFDIWFPRKKFNRN
jgi:hydrophobic/amphiphilic exporter-1 (mainly G- bacteria), HAE1 family